jgi:hypothetical protein
MRPTRWNVLKKGALKAAARLRLKERAWPKARSLRGALKSIGITNSAFSFHFEGGTNWRGNIGWCSWCHKTGDGSVGARLVLVQRTRTKERERFLHWTILLHERCFVPAIRSSAHFRNASYRLCSVRWCWRPAMQKYGRYADRRCRYHTNVDTGSPSAQKEAKADRAGRMAEALKVLKPWSPTYQPCVYVYVRDNRAHYVGQSTNLDQRVRTHQMGRDGIFWLPCKEKDRTNLERMLIDYLQPTRNFTYKTVPDRELIRQKGAVHVLARLRDGARRT